MIIIRTENLLIDCSIIELRESPIESWILWAVPVSGGEEVILKEFDSKIIALKTLNRIHASVRGRQRTYDLRGNL
jgi:hypothetical protein